MCSSIFSVFYTAFGFILKLCCNITGGYYILAVLLFSVIMQVVLFPLGIKQQKSSIKLAKMKPKEMLIREKYKGRNDRVTQQKMQMEIQELYRQEGYSMYSGCLPMLIQLPIIIILYGVIRMPLTYTSTKDVNTPAQYEIAAEILDSAIAAIDNSGLLENATEATSEAVSGEASEATSAVTEEATKKSNLKTFRENYVALIKSYAGESSVDSNGRYISNFITTSSEYTENTQVEYSLVTFILKDYRQVIMDDLKANGISDEIIAETVAKSPNFSDEIKEALPDFTYLGGEETLLDTPKNYGFSTLLIIPLLVFITSVLSFICTRKFSPNMTGEQQGGFGNGFLMKWGLPLFSAYLAWATFSAAIGIYWIYRTILQIAQTYILSKMYPVPVLSEEELAAFKKQMAQKKKKTITIEVDEDDTTYDHLAVKKNSSSEDSKPADTSSVNNSGYEMLKGDDKDIKTKVDWAPLKEDKPKDNGSDKKEGN